MLAKLIAILLEAKAGAISGVFLLGATGALISVSASNGVTTVTITEASPSPSASASPALSVTPTPSPTPTASPTLAAAVTPKHADSAACATEAKAIEFQVKRVDSAFSKFHHDLERLEKERSKDVLKTADRQLKEIRRSAVKAIHATRTCNDDDEDEDETKATTSDDKDKDKDKDKHEDKDKDEVKATTGLTFSGTAESIATQAIAAMEAAFETAKAAPVTTKKSESTKHPEETKRPEGTKHPEGTKRPEVKSTPKPGDEHKD